MLFPNRNFSLTAGLVTALTLNQCYAGQDLDLIASVTNTTCQTQVSDGGAVNLGTVNLSYFPTDVTAETEYGGGKTFTIEVTGCTTDAASTTPTQLKMNFVPQSGHLANGNSQVFANDDEQLSTGAKNVGIVIFSTQSGGQPYNILAQDGTSRTMFSITSDDLISSTWTFYSRMQRVVNSLAPQPGVVRSRVLVDVYYE
ncbi:TPA: fimbrial protein [Escherichia coli]|uniref:fimbrial-like protein n=1 Tax=Escherichia coli TaxID=562 RepID=UPI00388FA4DB|nr:fimbrial protein [Escherichia coli]HCB4630525.1 fimbrial protein [Escherichia coli]